MSLPVLGAHPRRSVGRRFLGANLGMRMCRYFVFAVAFFAGVPVSNAQVLPPSAPAAAVTPFRTGTFLCVERARGGVKYNDESRLWESVAFEELNKFLVRADFVRQRTIFGKPGERPAIVGA